MSLLEMTISHGKILFGTCVLGKRLSSCGVLLQASLMCCLCPVPLTGAERGNCHHGDHQQWEIHL